MSKSRTPEYWAWKAMRNRCNNPQAPQYKDYGGRGIKVCGRWIVFNIFLADMGTRPSSQHTLERRDNALGYSPDNCTWITRAEQMRNTRRNINVTRDGETLCLQDWCNRFKRHYETVRGRLRRNWTMEAALTKPTLTINRNGNAKYANR